MKNRTTPYILEKDDQYLVFHSEKSACEFLGVPRCCVASAARHKVIYHGYKVIKGTPESDIYADKRLRKIWESMHERCERAKHIYFSHYGGRGISVCTEWSDYLPFAKWARENGYSDELQIDRIDVNGNYEPSNCRWVTAKEQQNNKRTNRIVEYCGRKYTLTQLAEECGINKTTLKERLNMGWSVEKAVTQPIRLRTNGYRPSHGARMEETDERT